MNNIVGIFLLYSFSKQDLKTGFTRKFYDAFFGKSLLVKFPCKETLMHVYTIIVAIESY